MAGNALGMLQMSCLCELFLVWNRTGVYVPKGNQRSSKSPPPVRSLIRGFLSLPFRQLYFDGSTIFSETGYTAHERYRGVTKIEYCTLHAFGKVRESIALTPDSTPISSKSTFSQHFKEKMYK